MMRSIVNGNTIYNARSDSFVVVGGIADGEATASRIGDLTQSPMREAVASP